MSKKENLYFEKINKNHPTLVFKLLLPPEESIRRKPFEDIQDVTRKHQIVRNLAFPNSTVYEIDATQDYQQELIEIKNKIWLELLKAQG